MVKRLDPEDRSLLQFRPNIRFIEPEVTSEPIVPISEPQLEDIKNKRRQVKNLANAVNVLATTIQSMVDDKAKNMKIKLDPSVDPAAVAAMSRQFPDENALEITYEQYKEAKECLRELGNSIGEKALITPSQVSNERDNADLAQQNKTTNRIAQMGGFDTIEAIDGSLRPEVQPSAQIIPPINIPRIQISLICILVNYIWKNFIKKTVVKSSPPVSWAFKGLPNKICDPGADIELPGLFMLGDSNVPDLLTGKAQAAAKKAVGV